MSGIFGHHAIVRLLKPSCLKVCSVFRYYSNCELLRLSEVRVSSIFV